MRGISLWQPWASLIFTGADGVYAKTFETRSWCTPYRGPLVICASKGGLAKWEERDLIEASWFGEAWKFQGALAPLVGKPFNLDLEMNSGHEWPGVKIEDLPRGVALGIVDLVDCRRTEDITQGEIARERWFGNYAIGRFAWKLENPRLFAEPIKVVGKQGFFDVRLPEALIRQYISKQQNT